MSAQTAHFSRKKVALAFGAALRKARADRRISQERLAALGQFDRTYPSLLERGLRTPTLTVVFALAEALEVHPLELVNETVALLQESEEASESEPAHGDHDADEPEESSDSPHEGSE